MKQKKSNFDDEQKGLFLVAKCGKNRLVAIATGTIFTKGDPKMKSHRTFHIDVPAAAGMAANQVMDFTSNKIGMGHLMIKNSTSAGVVNFFSVLLTSERCFVCDLVLTECVVHV